MICNFSYLSEEKFQTMKENWFFFFFYILCDDDKWVVLVYRTKKKKKICTWVCVVYDGFKWIWLDHEQHYVLYMISLIHTHIHWHTNTHYTISSFRISNGFWRENDDEKKRDKFYWKKIFFSKENLKSIQV